MAVTEAAELRVSKSQVSLKVVLVFNRRLLLVGCMNHPLSVMSCLVSLSLPVHR